MIIIGLVYMELTYHLLQTNQHTSTPTLYSWSCLIGTLQWSIRQIAVNLVISVGVFHTVAAILSDQQPG